ncbi:hypothetical protein R1sor_022489 [Riccia sorocarpa]|uniref:Transposase n=1 Tax=Riccia sorocarpa TaxID=122646 RepID=A0ABD3GK22_9MARC
MSLCMSITWWTAASSSRRPEAVEEAQNFKFWLKEHLRPEVEVGIGFYWDPCWRDHAFPVAAKAFLEKNVSVGIRKQELYRMLHIEGLIDPSNITRAQVNYWVAEIESCYYGEKDEDQMRSASNFIRREDMGEKGFEQTLYEDNDEFQAFAFTMPFWKHGRAVKKLVTDSTFKINAMRLEMFGMMANLGRFGVPLSYCFYNKKVNVGDPIPSQYQMKRLRKEVLARWYRGLYERDLQSIFLLTDKDVGQIWAAKESLPNTFVQLCLKHSMDAIEKRMAAVDMRTNPYCAKSAHETFDFIDPAWQTFTDDVVSGNICPEEYRKEVKRFFKFHFNAHPLIPDLMGYCLSQEEVHERSVLEAYSFCKERGLIQFWGYLWNEWYSHLKWQIFSRVSKTILSMSRTTNLVESHWQKIKQDYSHAMNRPRLDHWVYIVSEKVCLDMSIKLKQFLGRREFPS